MRTRTPIVARTAEIRAETIAILTCEFGSPESGDGYERWVIKLPAPHYPVHVVVNAPVAPDRTDVLVFDPGAMNGGQVVERRIHTIDETIRLVEDIKRSVAAHLCHHRPKFRTSNDPGGQLVLQFDGETTTRGAVAC